MPTVIVHNGNFEQAMRKFKKKVLNAGTIMEVRNRQHYEKPSIRRNRAKAAARMRWQKHVRDQQIPKKEY